MEAATAQEPEQLTEEAALAALVVILASGLSLAAMTGFAQRLLGALGIPAGAVRRALALLHPHLRAEFGTDRLDPAASWLRRTLPARQASYLVAASRRLAAGGSEDAERTYLRQHLDAELRRREAVGRVDRAARRWGPVLGWHALMDDPTPPTPACKAAHGKNFRADRPPAIGWPRTLHAGRCRCSAGRPWPGAEMLPALP